MVNFRILSLFFKVVSTVKESRDIFHDNLKYLVLPGQNSERSTCFHGISHDLAFVCY